MAAPTDEELALGAAKGDEKARSALIRRHLGQVWGLALFHTGDAARAADLTRDLLVNALSGLGRIPDPRKLRSWLHTSSLEAIQKVIAEAPPGARASGAPAARGEGALDKMQLLPDNLRQALVLRYFEGLSYGKISTRLGVPRDRVDLLLRRAKEMVHRSTGRDPGQER